MPEGTCIDSLINSPRGAYPSNYPYQDARHVSATILDPPDLPIHQLNTFHREQNGQSSLPKCLTYQIMMYNKTVVLRPLSFEVIFYATVDSQAGISSLL